jgi:ribosomal protein L7/L12
MESALRYMRGEGLSQIECVKAVKALTGGNLREAKEIVHFSETWSDMRPHQERLHKDLSDGLSAE